MTYLLEITGSHYKQSLAIPKLHIVIIAICMAKCSGQESKVVISDVLLYTMSLYSKSAVVGP